MNKQIFRFFAKVLLVITLLGGITTFAQNGSTDRDNPVRITTRTVTANVSSELGDYRDAFYSIVVDEGTVTIDFTAKATNGMNITLGVEGADLSQSVGPLSSGGNDRMNGRTSFRVPARQTLLIQVAYSGNARYTIKFGGSVLPSGPIPSAETGRVRPVTRTVSSELGDYREVVYSVVANRGYVTLDFTAKARDGMNITVGIEGREVSQSIGPLASGGDDTMSGNARFYVPERQTLTITVTYSGTAKYTIDLAGSVVSITER